jgi:hypothetical protein
MLYPNLFKRFVPFAAALVLGLFVASFFVNIAPSWRGGRGRMYRPWSENQRLKLENEELKSRIEELTRTYPDCKSSEYKNLDLYNWEAPASPPMPKMDKRLKEKLERLENK